MLTGFHMLTLNKELCIHDKTKNPRLLLATGILLWFFTLIRI